MEPKNPLKMITTREYHSHTPKNICFCIAGLLQHFHVQDMSVGFRRSTSAPTTLAIAMMPKGSRCDRCTPLLVMDMTKSHSLSINNQQLFGKEYVAGSGSADFTTQGRDITVTLNHTGKSNNKAIKDKAFHLLNQKRTTSGFFYFEKTLEKSINGCRLLLIQVQFPPCYPNDFSTSFQCGINLG